MLQSRVGLVLSTGDGTRAWRIPERAHVPRLHKQPQSRLFIKLEVSHIKTRVSQPIASCSSVGTPTKKVGIPVGLNHCPSHLYLYCSHKFCLYTCSFSLRIHSLQHLKEEMIVCEYRCIQYTQKKKELPLIELIRYVIWYSLYFPLTSPGPNVIGHYS